MSQDIENASEETGAEQVEQTQATAKPAGYDPIDLENAPPEVKDRLTYLYRQVKDGQRQQKAYEKTTRELHEIAQRQAQVIEDLQRGVGQVVSHVHDRDIAARQAQIEEDMDKAFNDGDMPQFRKLQTQLTDLAVAKVLAKERAAAQIPAKETRRPSTEYNSYGGDLGIDAEDFEAWGTQRDANGNYIRPWYFAGDEEDPDPAHLKALSVTQTVLSDRRFAHLTQREKQAEIDRRMSRWSNPNAGTQGPTRNVMGGNLTTTTKSNTVKLSPELEKLAIRTQFAGPSKSNDEHIAAYRAQLARFKKGGR